MSLLACIMWQICFQNVLHVHLHVFYDFELQSEYYILLGSVVIRIKSCVFEGISQSV